MKKRVSPMKGLTHVEYRKLLGANIKLPPERRPRLEHLIRADLEQQFYEMVTRWDALLRPLEMATSPANSVSPAASPPELISGAGSAVLGAIGSPGASEISGGV